LQRPIQRLASGQTPMGRLSKNANVRTRILARRLRVLVYRLAVGNAYWKSTDPVSAAMQVGDFRKRSSFTEDYHQQYLAKNPNGYCGIIRAGVPFKSAELQVGEKA
jgi:hypothetical protein